MADDPREPDEAKPTHPDDLEGDTDADTLPAAPSKNKDTALGDTDQHSTENA